MTNNSISQLTMFQRLLRVARSPLRAFVFYRRRAQVRSVVRAMHRAWPETAKRVESDLPHPTRAAYYSARRELDVWAWVNGVPFEPFAPHFDSVADDGEGDAGVIAR